MVLSQLRLLKGLTSTTKEPGTRKENLLVEGQDSSLCRSNQSMYLEKSELWLS